MSIHPVCALFSALTLLLTYAAASSPARAEKVIRLFEENGEATRNYRRTISELAPGDILEFEDGSRFAFKEDLGTGKTTRILETDKTVYAPDDVLSLALRVPPQPNPVYRKFITETHEGYSRLGKVPAVRMFHYYKDQFVVVERVKVEFSLIAFLNGFSLGPEDSERVTDEFLDFVKEVALYIKIGDFHYGQIVYVKDRGWLLLDWSKDTRKPPPGTLFYSEEDNVFRKFETSFLENKTPFKVLANWKTLYPRVLNAIKEARLAAGLLDARDYADLPSSTQMDNLSTHGLDKSTWYVPNQPCSISERLSEKLKQVLEE